MRRFGIAACLLILAGPVLAQVDKKAEKELLAGYQQIITAMKNKDLKAVMAKMTPDATMIENGRTMTRAQFEPILKQQMGMMKLQSASIKFSKVVVKGNLANTVYAEQMTAMIPGPDGKPATVAVRSNYTGTFKKVGGDWKMHRSETVGTPTMTMNGKPFNPGAPPSK
jgi:ketosteroid isomerase-like protein